MDTQVSSLLRVAKPDYVSPAQLLHEHLDHHMPFWAREKCAPAAYDEDVVSSFYKMLASEGKQQDTHLPVRKHQDLLNLYSYYANLSAP